MDKTYLYQAVEEKAPIITDVSDKIWEYAELSMMEIKSAAEYISVLKAEGFTVQENLCGIATAFSGSFGSGKPVIGFLGEFDALSGLSQVPGISHPQPLVDGGCGHGCGHNLLGAGALGAAIAVKKAIEAGHLQGTVVFYGCPGEEGCAGKTFMARDGMFRDLDAALTWHPGDTNEITIGSNAASIQMEYHFAGNAAHAADDPWNGRSALDAAELMNVGVQFLREHMKPKESVHYSFTDAGGVSPNVVQPTATLVYMIRSESVRTAKLLAQRVDDIAKGAALMTSTKESHVFIKACSNLVHNTVLRKILHEKLVEIGSPEMDAQDMQTARQFSETALQGMPQVDPENPIWDDIWAYTEDEVQGYSSTDVGDVSWVCPTAQILTATFARGTPPHTWQMVAQGKLPQAHKMTRYAAKVMAASAVELMARPELLAQAQAEFRQRVGEGYDAPIPKDVMPKAMDSFKK